MAILLNTTTGEEVTLQPQHVFGRYPADTILNCPSVDVAHATVLWDGEFWYLEDYSSSGTYISGVRVLSNSPFRLNKGESLRFGSNGSVRWVLLDDSAPQGHEKRGKKLDMVLNQGLSSWLSRSQLGQLSVC